MDSMKSVVYLLVMFVVHKTTSENPFKSVPVKVKTNENSTVLLPCYVDDTESCATPEGATGNCVELSKCPVLHKLIKTTKIAPKDVELLRNSACGFQGSAPKVCCPYMCLTNEGEQGKCVGRNSCTDNAKTCFGTDSVCCSLKADVQVGNCQSKVSAFPPNQKTHCCGRESTWDDRITGGGGVETSIDKYPWLTLIEYKQKGGSNKVGTFCGGVLISGKYVLTAAHCVTGPILENLTLVSVRLGEHDTSTKIDCRPVVAGGEDCNEETVSIPVETAIPHPEYNPNAKRNDIALIRLTRNAPFTDFIRPICLPTLDITKDSSSIKFYVAGWGKVNSTLLQSPFKVHVDVPFVPQEKCQIAYSVASRNATLWKGQLCAGGEVGKDACKGDSGGPLMYEGKEQTHVTGVVSFGTKRCGSMDVPGIYTKVFEYVDWIYSNIEA